MGRYSLTKAATRDLRGIDAYLRQYSPPAADRVKNELRDAMRSLGALRRMGHPRPDLTDDPVLFFSVPPYHIIYRPDLKPIEIVRVIHGARDIPSELSGK